VATESLASDETGCRKFDNEDKCLSHSGAWPFAKKFVTQIFTLIMPIKSMISLLASQQTSEFGPPTVGPLNRWVNCQKLFTTNK